MNRDLGRKLQVLAVVILSSSAAWGDVGRLEGTLSANGPSFEGYNFVAFEVVSMGGDFLVSLESSDFDAFLIVRSPTGDFQIDDDAGGSRNARIALANAERGGWLIFATSLGEGGLGSFTLIVDGASSASGISPPGELSIGLVEEAFAARGVISVEALAARAEEQRQQSIRLLADQLGLDTFREQMEREFRAIQDEEADPLPTSYEQRYEQLEGREEELSHALKESAKLERSGAVVSSLIEYELSSVRLRLDLLSDQAERQLLRQEVLRLTLNELEGLERVMREAHRVQGMLIGWEKIDEVERKKLLAKLSQLRETSKAKAESFAVRLVGSGLVSPDRTILSEAAERMLGGETVAARFPAGVKFLSSLPVQRSAGDRVGGSDSSRTVDTSIWLPELFPWPPPQPSSQAVLDVVVSGWRDRVSTLGDVDDVLTRALDESGYSGPSYFGVMNGFALVTQLEQVDRYAVSLDGVARWSTTIAEMTRFTLSEYLKALLTAPPGYWRVIVFTVTSVPFSATGARRRFSIVRRWARSGVNHLPEEVRRVEYGEKHRVTVLIYEFEKRDQRDEPLTLETGRHTARHHLERAGILAGLH